MAIKLFRPVWLGARFSRTGDIGKGTGYGKEYDNGN